MDHLRDLIDKREAADRSLVDAFDRSAGKLGGGEHWTKVSGPTAPGKPAVPVPDHNVGTPKAPTPAAHSPVAAPGTAPAPSAGTSTITPAQANATAALMAGQQRQGQPAQIPQQPAALSPPPAPAASMGAGSSPRNGKSAIDADDIDSAIAVPAALPLSSAAHIRPAAPAPVAPAPPAVTGTSSTDWHTGADTTGQPDGAARTALSSAVPEQAVGRAAAGGAGVAGQAMDQPLGQLMMPGGMGGAGANGRATKVLKYSPEQAELLGHLTIGAAVRGGTILQRPVDVA
jgi:hypothetical protein